VVVLLGVAVLYSITSLLGIEKGMRRISDWNVYFCLGFLAFICLIGSGQFILDSILDSFGIMISDFVRMTTFTDPVAKSSYPQDWTVFYMVYWFVFGPFTGLFVAKISKGRKLKEIIANMLFTGSLGMFSFFGVVTAYQQSLRIEGIMDVPAIIASGNAATLAGATLNTMPFSGFATILYLVVIILFLATTLDATAFALSSTVSRGLKGNEEPKRSLKFVWCLVLVAIPLAVTFAGTDINTIKAIVLATGMPLVIILGIAYHGLLKEMKKDFGHYSREQILDFGDPAVPDKVLVIANAKEEDFESPAAEKE
jgi:BCCT family betaine/carnitine transporter